MEQVDVSTKGEKLTELHNSCNRLEHSTGGSWRVKWLILILKDFAEKVEFEPVFQMGIRLKEYTA